MSEKIDNFVDLLFNFDMKELEDETKFLENYKKLQQEKQQLNNNWNELKKWINEQKEWIKDLPTYTNDIMNNHIGMICGYNNVLEEMIELESGKNE